MTAEVDLPAAVAAQHRAMPFTRLVDCGMDHADARELLSETAAGKPWDDVAARIADVQMRRAQAALDAGHHLTAAQAFRFAAAALMFAQMAHNNDTPAKRELYSRHITAATAAAALAKPPIERVLIRYRHGELSGWLRLPVTDRPPATVIIWGGLSGWGAAYLPIADAYAARGLAVLLAEGPGQGLSRLQEGLYLDEHAIDGFRRFLDVVQAIPRLGESIGVQGMSFGGLFAAHVAASDPRVGAVVINGAPAVPRVPQFRGPREQIAAATGTEDAQRMQEVMLAVRFDPAEHPISCPLLLLHGGRDPLAQYADQEPFFRAANPKLARERIWPDGEHTLYNHAAERDAATGDWFAEHLTT